MISGNRWSYFNEREKHIAVTRVLLDDPAKAKGQIEITGTDILSTMKQPRIWIHVLICLTSNIPVNSLQTYAPSIIKSLGFSKVAANALTSVPLFIAMLMVLTLSKIAYATICWGSIEFLLTLHHSDRTGYCGPFAIIGQTWALIAYICVRVTPVTANKWNRYASVVAAAAVNSVVQ